MLTEEMEGKWRLPDSEAQPTPRPGEFVIFLSFLKRELAFPTSEFFRRLLTFYRIQIHDLSPNSILQISCFIMLYECYLGCPPFFHLWLSIFHGKLQTETAKGPMQVTGGITFQVCGGSEYLDLGFHKKVNNWKNQYFYMKETTPDGQVAIPPFSSTRSRPRNLNAATEEKDAALLTLMKA
jgi:hypothetical protein